MIRGCGSRKPGGVYICSELKPGGLPLEIFIIDPPIPYEADKPFRVPIIIERGGTNHLLFWVGKEHYPFTSDFIEEARLFGASKRVLANFPIEKLANSSMMFFVHPEAIIENYQRLPPPEYCPKDKTKHLSNDEYCIGHVYQVATASDDDGTRRIGDTTYQVYPTEVIPERLTFKPGIFLRLPITDIDNVLKDGKPHPEVTKKADSVKIPINYVEE